MAFEALDAYLVTVRRAYGELERDLGWKAGKDNGVVGLAAAGALGIVAIMSGLGDWTMLRLEGKSNKQILEDPTWEKGASQ